MEHIHEANHRLFIHFFLFSVPCTCQSFFSASSKVLVLWDILQYSGMILHFQCFITVILTNHTCLYHVARGYSGCLPHSLPGVHCRHLGRWPTWELLWRPKLEKHFFSPFPSDRCLKTVKNTAQNFFIILSYATICHSYYSEFACCILSLLIDCISCILWYSSPTSENGCKFLAIILISYACWY